MLRKYSEEFIKEVVNEAIDGNRKEIIKKYHLSNQTLYRWLHIYGEGRAQIKKRNEAKSKGEFIEVKSQIIENKVSEYIEIKVNDYKIEIMKSNLKELFEAMK